MLCRWLQLSDYMRGLGYEGVAQAKAAAGGSDFMLALFFRPASCFLCQFCCCVEHAMLLQLPATHCVANCFWPVGWMAYCPRAVVLA